MEQCDNLCVMQTAPVSPPFPLSSAPEQASSPISWVFISSSPLSSPSLSLELSPPRLSPQPGPIVPANDLSPPQLSPQVQLRLKSQSRPLLTPSKAPSPALQWHLLPQGPLQPPQKYLPTPPRKSRSPLQSPSSSQPRLLSRGVQQPPLTLSNRSLTSKTLSQFPQSQLQLSSQGMLQPALNVSTKNAIVKHLSSSQSPPPSQDSVQPPHVEEQALASTLPSQGVISQPLRPPTPPTLFNSQLQPQSQFSLQTSPQSSQEPSLTSFPPQVWMLQPSPTCISTPPPMSPPLKCKRLMPESRLRSFDVINSPLKTDSSPSSQSEPQSSPEPELSLLERLQPLRCLSTPQRLSRPQSQSSASQLHQSSQSPGLSTSSLMSTSLPQMPPSLLTLLGTPSPSQSQPPPQSSPPRSRPRPLSQLPPVTPPPLSKSPPPIPQPVQTLTDSLPLFPQVEPGTDAMPCSIVDDTESDLTAGATHLKDEHIPQRFQTVQNIPCMTSSVCSPCSFSNTDTFSGASNYSEIGSNEFVFRDLLQTALRLSRIEPCLESNSIQSDSDHSQSGLGVSQDVLSQSGDNLKTQSPMALLPPATNSQSVFSKEANQPKALASDYSSTLAAFGYFPSRNESGLKPRQLFPVAVAECSTAALSEYDPLDLSNPTTQPTRRTSISCTEILASRSNSAEVESYHDKFQIIHSLKTLYKEKSSQARTKVNDSRNARTEVDCSTSSAAIDNSDTSALPVSSSLPFTSLSVLGVPPPSTLPAFSSRSSTPGLPDPAPPTSLSLTSLPVVAWSSAPATSTCLHSDFSLKCPPSLSPSVVPSSLNIPLNPPFQSNASQLNVKSSGARCSPKRASSVSLSSKTSSKSPSSNSKSKAFPFSSSSTKSMDSNPLSSSMPSISLTTASLSSKSTSKCRSSRPTLNTRPYKPKFNALSSKSKSTPNAQSSKSTPNVSAVSASNAPSSMANALSSKSTSNALSPRPLPTIPSQTVGQSHLPMSFLSTAPSWQSVSVPMLRPYSPTFTTSLYSPATPLWPTPRPSTPQPLPQATPLLQVSSLPSMWLPPQPPLPSLPPSTMSSSSALSSTWLPPQPPLPSLPPQPPLPSLLPQPPLPSLPPSTMSSSSAISSTWLPPQTPLPSLLPQPPLPSLPPSTVSSSALSSTWLPPQPPLPSLPPSTMSSSSALSSTWIPPSHFSTSHHLPPSTTSSSKSSSTWIPPSHLSTSPLLPPSTTTSSSKLSSTSLPGSHLSTLPSLPSPTTSLPTSLLPSAWHPPPFTSWPLPHSSMLSSTLQPSSLPARPVTLSPGLAQSLPLGQSGSSLPHAFQSSEDSHALFAAACKNGNWALADLQYCHDLAMLKQFVASLDQFAHVSNPVQTNSQPFSSFLPNTLHLPPIPSYLDPYLSSAPVSAWQQYRQYLSMAGIDPQCFGAYLPPPPPLFKPSVESANSPSRPEQTNRKAKRRKSRK